MTYRKNRKVSKFDFYATGKKTFEDHLVELLKEPFYKKIKDICDNLKKTNKTTSKTLKAFQAEMASIRKWDYDDLKKSAKFVVNKSKASYIPKLIRAVIISNTKLLTATSSRKKVEVEINPPEPIAFFQKCFIEIGKAFYVEPFLVCDAGQQPGLRLKNITDSVSLIEGCIRKTINSFLPFDTILDIYIAQAEEDSDSEDEPEPEQPESDNESESEIESDDESEVSESEDDDEENTEDYDDEEVESDAESVHSVQSEKSEKSEGGEIVDLTEDPELIKQNDFTNDEEFGVADDLSISEDLPEEMNLISMKSEVQSAAPSQPQEKVNEQPPAPKPEEVKQISVKKPINSDAKPSNFVFHEDAEDL